VSNLSIKLYRIYVCYTNITLYHVIYSVRYYLRFHVTAVGLGTYYPRIWWSACTCVLAFCVASVVWSVWVHGCSYSFESVDWSRFCFWVF